MHRQFSILLIAILSLSTSAFAQDIITIDNADIKSGVFARIEKESMFPGGREAWIQFMMNNLVYPRKAVRQRIEGTVVLQFIVDKEGNITHLNAISGPAILQKAALELIRKSPKWIPAEQSGKKVRSYKKQPIVFKLTA